MDCYKDLFDNAVHRLRKAWLLKLDAMTRCNRQHTEYKKQRIDRENQMDSEASFDLSDEDCCDVN